MIFKLSPFVTVCYLAGFMFPAPVAATRGLSLSVTSPATVDNVKDVKVVTTLTNTGNETLKLVNSADGILSMKPNDAFTVIDTNGANVPYTGPSIVHSIRSGGSGAQGFTVLAPGESSKVSHDLSSLYGFSTSGSYRVKAHQDFNHLDREAGLVSVHANSRPGHVISIIDNPTNSIGRRAPQSTFIGCSVERQNRIAIVMEAVKSLVIAAHQFTAVPGNFFSQCFITWFGAYSDSRSQIVLHNWERMAAANLDTWVFDCGSCTLNAGAIANAARYGEISLCSAFWTNNNMTFQTDAIITRLVAFDSIAGAQIISSYDQPP